MTSATKFTAASFALKCGGGALLLFVLFFAGSIAESLSGIFDSAYGQVSTILRDSSSQWIVMASLAVHMVVFLSYEANSTSGFWRWNNPRVWQAGLLLCGAIAYAADRAPSEHALVFLSGMVVATSIAAWARHEARTWSGEMGSAGHIAIAFVLAVSMGLAMMCFKESDEVFYYHRQARWSGPWRNPNLAGLFMGTATVLALGAAIWSAKAICLRMGDTWRQKLWRYCLTALPLLVAALGVQRLLLSYSRGAWLATAFGLGYMIVRFSKLLRNRQSATTAAFGQAGEGADGGCAARFVRNARVAWVWSLGGVLIAAVLVLGQVRITELDIVADRVASVTNINDFSWRNRIAAWEGALKIMAENPWFGAGWSRPELEYQNYYLPANIDDGIAIQLNDYLVVGATLGFPALLCLGMLLWFSLAHGGRNSKNRGRNPQDCRMPQSEPVPDDDLDWPRTVCRAGAIVLAVGFWFDGGLFHLSLAVLFWLLVEFCRLESVPDVRDTAGKITNMKHRAIAWAMGVAGALILFGTLLWAKGRDPFSREWFRIASAGHRSFEGIVIFPKTRVSHSLVVYAYGSSDNLMSSGYRLRQLAELGHVAVGFEYKQTDRAVFGDQLDALLDYVEKRGWASGRSMIWVGIGHGADLLSEFAAKHCRRKPCLLILVNGAGAGENKSADAVQSIDCDTVLIFTGRDAPSALGATKGLVSRLQANGRNASLWVAPAAQHGAGPGLEGGFRWIAEYCLTSSEVDYDWRNFRSIGEWRERAPRLWTLLIPGLAWAGICAGWMLVKRRGLPRRKVHAGRKSLAWLFGAFALALALSCLGVYFVVRHLPVSERSLGIAKQFLVRPGSHGSLDYLAAQSAWCGMPLHALLDSVELSSYNNMLVAWPIEGPLFQEYVLSPHIDGNSYARPDWRRTLWEHFYPRVRRAQSRSEAARVVLQNLRERVTVVVVADAARDPATIWRRQVTDRLGFYIVAVAAFRSIGIPARLNSKEEVEYWDRGQWHLATMPTIVRMQ